ncbi:MAG: LamG domain-containing protein [Phycisphaeraceae bacterium]
MTTFKHVDFEVPAWGELAAGPQTWLAYRQAVLELNPFAYWRLGETTGTTALDELGIRHGTYQPNANGQWTGGTLGETGALYRDANAAAAFGAIAPGWIELPFIALPDDLTIVAWVKSFATTSSSSNTIFSWGQDSGLGHVVEFRIRDTSTGVGALQFLVKDAGGVQDVHGNTELRDAQWHHVAVTREGLTITLHVDAQLEASGEIDVDPALDYTQIGLVRRGGSNLQNPVEGTLDEVALFPHALTAGQIADLYHRGAGLFKPAA